MQKKSLPVVERRRGCWNCASFGRGELAKNHMQSCKRKDLANKIATLGYVPVYDRLGAMERPDFDNGKPIDARFSTWDKLVDQGDIGICLAGIDTDFVHRAYLCDKWRGADGASVATEGGKLDLLPEELRVKHNLD